MNSIALVSRKGYRIFSFLSPLGIAGKFTGRQIYRQPSREAAPSEGR